jgi:hypothetical protein
MGARGGMIAPDQKTLILKEDYMLKRRNWTKQ